jgi:hypothetical protein
MDLILGSVLYFLNEHDQVIGLLKKKTIWYVILRAIREKARTMIAKWEKSRQMTLTDTLERVRRRLNAIQKWLQFSYAILDQWKTLAEQFLSWLADGAQHKRIMRDDIADRYPLLWSKFLSESHSNDDFMRTCIANQASEEEDIWKQLNELKIETGNSAGQKNRAVKAQADSNVNEIDLPSAEEDSPSEGK